VHLLVYPSKKKKITIKITLWKYPLILIIWEDFPQRNEDITNQWSNLENIQKELGFLKRNEEENKKNRNPISRLESKDTKITTN